MNKFIKVKGSINAENSQKQAVLADFMTESQLAWTAAGKFFE